MVRNSVDVHYSHPVTPLVVHRLEVNGGTFTILTFDSRHHALEVVDNEKGPGTGARTAEDAAQGRGIAAINGGFFTAEGDPLGLVYEAGKKYGGLSSSSLGAGLYLHEPSLHRPGLLRRRAWDRKTTSTMHILQAGPFLLEDGKPVPGLSNRRARPRSFLLWDGHLGWAIGHCSSTTLSALAQTLAKQPVPSLKVRLALNLDGGSSCDLWIGPSVTGGPIGIRPFWAKDVRNYLVLTPNES